VKSEHELDEAWVCATKAKHNDSEDQQYSVIHLDYFGYPWIKGDENLERSQKEGLDKKEANSLGNDEGFRLRKLQAWARCCDVGEQLSYFMND